MESDSIYIDIWNLIVRTVSNASKARWAQSAINIMHVP